MTRIVHELGREAYGIEGHLTSLKPIRPENAPDSWEIRALRSFENGEKEFSSIEDMNGETYLRLMQPLKTEKNCLQCHAQQGHKIGDIRGGISVAVPAKSYHAAEHHHIQIMAIIHLLLWMVGLFGFLFGKKYLTSQIQNQIDTEQALNESEARFGILFEKAGDAIFVLEAEGDQTGKIVAANQVAADMHGYTMEELMKLNITDLDSEKASMEAPARIQRILNGEWIVDEIEHVKKNGDIFMVEIGAGLITMKDKRYILAIDRDISERKKTEDQIRRSQKLEAIGTLAGGIAHDFNNMLGVIMGNISFALTFIKKDQKELLDVLTDAEAGAKSAQSLTYQLLTFAKGGMPVKKPEKIGSLIKESSTFITRGSNVRCEFGLPDGLWTVEIDSGQIIQVINNLVINAQQAMPDGGFIKIEAENINLEPEQNIPLPSGRYVKVTIQDTGIGIAEKHLPNIFDPYYTTKQKGSGLGLATSFSIINKHDGHIAVKSTLGEGTIFSIYLPVTDAEIHEENQNSNVVHKGSGNVLIMDDDEPILKMTGKMLLAMGYTSQFVTDGKQAIETYKNALLSGTPFDLVILDLTIPGGLGGKETIQALLKIDQNVKALVSSGYSNDPVIANYEDYGFFGIVPKPYTKNQLAEALNNIFKNKIGTI